MEKLLLAFFRVQNVCLKILQNEIKSVQVCDEPLMFKSDLVSFWQNMKIKETGIQMCLMTTLILSQLLAILLTVQRFIAYYFLHSLQQQ